MIESFNARLRDELLNREIFYSLREARIIIESWRRYYNSVRPHGSLGYRAPAPVVFMPPFTARATTQYKPAPPPALPSDYVYTNINLGPASGGCSLEVTYPNDNLLVEADSTRSVLTFSNILDNAQKHTNSQGNISISVNAENDMAVIVFRDDGAGFEFERRENIFDMFYQTRPRTTLNLAGTGIGLAIHVN